MIGGAAFRAASRDNIDIFIAKIFLYSSYTARKFSKRSSLMSLPRRARPGAFARPAFALSPLAEDNIFFIFFCPDDDFDLIDIV